MSSISPIRWLETSTVRPSSARSRSSSRTQRMPSGSSPLTGSSSRRTSGSPSSAAAMPSRWPMPSEKPRTRSCATDSRPTRSMTSSTREPGRSLLCASARRCAYAVRPGWRARGSISAPTRRIGWASSRNGRPSTVAVPEVGRVRPRMQRSVVVLPEPFGPRKPVTRPGSTVTVRSSTATRARYAFVSPSSSITAPAWRASRRRWKRRAPAAGLSARTVLPVRTTGYAVSDRVAAGPEPSAGVAMPPARQPDQSAPRTVSPTGVGYDGPKDGRDPRGAGRGHADHAQRCAHPRQRPLAQGGPARAGPPRRTSTCARRSCTSTTSGSRSAWCTPAAPGRTACSPPTAPPRRSPGPPCSPRRAWRRRSSSGSPPSWARAARPTPSGTPADSRRSSTRRKGPGTSSATTSRSSSSRTRSSSPTSSTRASRTPTGRSRRPSRRTTPSGTSSPSTPRPPTTRSGT